MTLVSLLWEMKIIFTATGLLRGGEDCRHTDRVGEVGLWRKAVLVKGNDRGQKNGLVLLNIFIQWGCSLVLITPFPRLSEVFQASASESVLTSFFRLHRMFVPSIRNPWICLQLKPGIRQILLYPYVARSKFVSLIMLFLPFLSQFGNPIFFLLIKPLSRETDNWSNSYWGKLAEAIPLPECGPLAASCIVGKHIDMWT